MVLVGEVYKITVDFPPEEKYELARALKRSAISIPSNIAEGCRGSNKELKHFLNIALGSSFELETQMEIGYDLNYIDAVKFQEFLDSLHRFQKRMNSFRSKISN